MNKETLYAAFEEEFKTEVLPGLELQFPRDEFRQPIYHMIDNFPLCRFRSGFPLMLAQEFKKGKTPFKMVGAALELAFATALVEDDIVDQDVARAGIKSSHIKYGYPAAIVAIGLAHNTVGELVDGIARHTDPSTAKLMAASFHNCNRMLYESFGLENTMRARYWGAVIDDRLPSELERIHLSKTIHGPTALHCSGLILEGERPGIAELLRTYSSELSVAGQIKNDVYDLTRYATDGISSDIKNGYVTVPVLLYLNRLSEDERTALLADIQDPDNSDRILTTLKKSTAIDDSIRLGEAYVHRAKKLVQGQFSDSFEDILFAWADANTIKFNRPREDVLASRYAYRK